MNERTLRTKVSKLKELESQQKELEKQISKLKEDIKSEMTEQNTQEMTVGDYIVRWTTLTKGQFNAKAFKESHPRLYNRYMTQAETRRFSIV